MFGQPGPTPGELFALKAAQSRSPLIAMVTFMATLMIVGVASSAFDVQATMSAALAIPCVIGFAGSIALTALWVAKGPVVGLLLKDGEVLLVGRNGKALARAPLSDVPRQPIISWWQTIYFPAVALQIGKRSVVVTTWRRDFGWNHAAPQGVATHRLVDDNLWPTLVAGLGLAEVFGGPPNMPPAPPAPPGPARRRFPLPVLTLPVAGLAAFGLTRIFQPEQPLAPECLKASRCCLADLNRSPPVKPGDVQRCIAEATAARETCKTPARSSCNPWPPGEVRSWSWSQAAGQVPAGSARQEPIKKLYPRVSCKDAADRLLSAMAQHQNGDWIAIRASSLFVKALTPADKDAFIYCDGYPIPIIAGNTMWSRKLMRQGQGPHTVLARPLAQGRYQVSRYCFGCDVVGKERTPYTRR